MVSPKLNCVHARSSRRSPGLYQLLLMTIESGQLCDLLCGAKVACLLLEPTQSGNLPSKLEVEF